MIMRINNNNNNNNNVIGDAFDISINSKGNEYAIKLAEISEIVKNNTKTVILKAA